MIKSEKTALRLLALISLIVITVAWALAFWQSREMEQQLFADTGRRMEMMAQTHAQQAALSLAVADESLKRLQDTLRLEGAAGFARVAAVMSRGEAAGGALNRVALIGKDGRMTQNFLNGQGTRLVDTSDRAYFKTFRDQPRDEIYFAEPILGKVSREWIILFARPVLVDGQFAGVIFVGFGSEQLSKLVNTAGEDGLLISMFSPGNRIVARSQAIKEALGREILLPAQSETGHYFDFRSPVDGVTRRFSVRKVPNWGLRIIAGMDHRVLKSQVAGYARIAMIPALLLTLLLLPAVVLIQRSMKRQQAAEHARFEEARRTRTVLETMSAAVLLLDATQSILFANQAATQWLPVTGGANFPERLAAAGLSLAMENGSNHVAHDPIQALCIASGQVIDNVRVVATDPQKNHLWLVMRAQPLLDENGKVNGVVVTLEDRSSEHERLADAEMARDILARMNDAVMITDPQARILMVNAAYLRLSGFAESELIGQKPNLVRSTRHDDVFWVDMWQTLRDTKKWSGRVWNLRKDGTEYCVWHTITSVCDRYGQVVRYVAVSRDITEQQAHESNLWQQANFDALTGLANRTRFTDQLAHSLVAAARHKQHFAVCYLDLDHFKPVNDTLGHAAGDELLRQAAQRMHAALRKEDTLARIGGDEFALLMPHVTSADSAIVIAEKILKAIQQPFVLEAGSASIGISIGIALYPEHGLSAEALTGAADQALYAAKTGGRNTWRLGTPPDIGS